MANYSLPNLLNIRDYANFLVKHQGEQAEKAGHTEEALGYYRTAAAFGRLMQLQSKSLIEVLIGVAVEKVAAEPNLIAALRKSGHTDEAALEEARLAGIKSSLEVVAGKDLMTPTSNFFWSGLLVRLLGTSVLFFAALTFLAVVYVNAKRWIRRDKRGRLFQIVTVAENYLPLLLFLSCAALYIVFAPYAYNFRHYMTAAGEIHNLEPFFANMYPLLEAMQRNDLALPNPFGDYIPWAAAGLVVVLSGWEELRARRAASSS